MRIIGGIAAGTILKVPKGFDVRPTADLVRQALFNSLGPRVEGARVLELFGGTGALSLECLSRGARNAVCVEKSPRHASFIRENLQLAKLSAAALEVRAQDAFTVVAQFAASCQQFDLIVADPPFGEKNVGRRSASFAQQLLDNENLPKLLAAGGLFIMGHARRDQVTLPPAWRETKTLKHGDTMIRFLQLPVPDARSEEQPS